MTTIAGPMTADALWRLPKDGHRHELVKGEPRTLPPAGGEHGVLGGKLAGKLFQHVDAHQLGVVLLAETGFLLSRAPDTVRAADIAFVSKQRLPAGGAPKGFWPGAPDLAVEVVSPGGTVYEVEEKVADWLTAGAKLVWVLNPKRRTVTVYTADSKAVILHSTDTLTGGEVVPAFALPVADIFG